MLYITTTKTLKSVTLTECDKLLLFYKESDMLKMSEFAQMIQTGALPSKCEMIKDRDDMLVLLGAYLAQTEDRVTFLDPTIPVPARYAQRIVSEKPARKTTRKNVKRMPKNNSKDSEHKVADLQDCMNAPELDNAEASDKKKTTNTNVQEELVFKDKQAEQLYNILQLRSEDVNFAWPTEMLMMNIISDIENSENDTECESAIRARNNGDKIWEVVKQHFDDVKKIVEGK